MILSNKSRYQLIDAIDKGMDHHHIDPAGPDYTCIYCLNGRATTAPHIKHKPDCEGIEALRILEADTTRYLTE